MLAYKSTVRVDRRTVALTVIENAVIATRERLGYPDVAVVTSIADGVHMEGSKHYQGMALDLRTHTMGSLAKKRRFASELRSALGDLFTVLLERIGTPNEHLHIQVKKGTVYP